MKYVQWVAQQRINATFIKWAELYWLQTSLRVLEKNTQKLECGISLSPVYLIRLFTHTICVYITVARAIL